MVIKDGNTAFASETVTGFGRPAAQNAYQTLQANNVFDNKDYLGADEFLDANGTNNTVDTGTSTAAYESGNKQYILNFTDEAAADATHDPDGFTNPANAFDSNDTTYADKVVTGSAATYDWELGKTFSSKYVSWVKVKADLVLTDNSSSISIILQTYDGATWSSETTLDSGAGGGGADSASFNGTYFLDSTVQGVRIFFDINKNATNSNTQTAKLYTLEYGNFDASSTVETNEIISLNSAPKSIVVYANKTLPASTSITVDVSDDGGATFAITDKPVNEYIDTTSLSGLSLALKFTLATTDTSVTPRLFGYSVAVCDD